MYSNDKKCAPNKKYIDGSCFTIDSLKIIAEEYNKINNVKTIEDYIDINSGIFIVKNSQYSIDFLTKWGYDDP